MARAKKRTGTKRHKKPEKVQQAAEPTVAGPSPSKTVRRLSRQEKRAAATHPPIASAPRLFVQTCVMLKSHWKLFLSMLFAYSAAYVLLVGVSGGGLSSAKAELLARHSGGLPAGASLLNTMLNSSGTNGGTAAGVYQTMLLLVISLTLIWALRQLHAGRGIRARDAFYKGSTPLIPFLLVLIVVGLELLPAAAGGALYGLAVNNGVAIGMVQKALVLVLCTGLAAVSVFWVCSSVFALYIVTEPDMTPVRALRAARDLVRYRRLEVIRKILFLPAVVMVIGAVILMPVALYLTAIATLVLLILTAIAIAVMHSYMYSLYREMS